MKCMKCGEEIPETPDRYVGTLGGVRWYQCQTCDHKQGKDAKGNEWSEVDMYMEADE